MAQPEENPEYISELKKLVNDKVISEMTAQIHLSDINKISNFGTTNTVNKSQQNPLISPEKFRNRRIMFVVLIFNAGVVIYLLIR
jgi:hypothetical protein